MEPFLQGPEPLSSSTSAHVHESTVALDSTYDILSPVKDLAVRIQITEARLGLVAKRMMTLTLPEPQEGVPGKRRKVLRVPAFMDDAADMVIGHSG